jgi:hypothetical protein
MKLKMRWLKGGKGLKIGAVAEGSSSDEFVFFADDKLDKTETLKTLPISSKLNSPL